MGNKKRITMYFLFIIMSFLFLDNVYALDIKLSEVNLIESSPGAIIDEASIEGDTIKTNAILSDEEDYVIYEIKINNNESESYVINSVTDDNKNKNVKIEYEADDKNINANSFFKIKAKIKYNQKKFNINEYKLDDILVTIHLLKEDGSSEEVIINPFTGDKIHLYLFLLIIAVTALIFVKKNLKIGKIKLVFFLIPIFLIMLPFIIFAYEQYSYDFVLKNISIKGEMLPYTVTFDSDGGTEYDPVTILFGNPIEELPVPEKNGCVFKKWIDEDGTEVREGRIIVGDLNIKATYDLITYNITYDLDGGTATNPTTYNVETDTFNLNNPTKSGYTFLGWSSDGGTTYQTLVTIFKGTTGHKYFKAYYSTNDDTTYKVVHRKMELDGETYTVADEDNLTGVTDSTVTPQVKEYTGFISPEPRDLVISGEGNSELVYDYEREKYSFTITDRSNIDIELSNEDNDYYFETPIKAVAKPVTGYDFKWSDNDTNYEKNFIITKDTTLTPIYTPKRNVKYVVNHYTQNLSEDESKILDTYSVYYTQNLRGTTDSTISPSVYNMPGFVIPESQTTTVAGDGSTKVDYYYDRHLLSIIYNINNGEFGETTTTTSITTDSEGNIIVDGRGINGGGERDDSQFFVPYGGKLKDALDPNNQNYLNIIKNNYNLSTNAEWNTEPDGTGINVNKINANMPVSKLADIEKSDKSITLYANWIPDTYTVIFDANGGIGSMENMVFEFDEEKQLPKGTFTNGSAIFGGWNTKPDGSGVFYGDEQIVKNISSTETLTLYAQYGRAEFDTGLQFNRKIKMYAGHDDVTWMGQSRIYEVEDTEIEDIVFVNTIDPMYISNDYIISSKSSKVPIYTWYDDNKIYIYSKDTKPLLNSNSDFMFANLMGLSNIDVTHYDSSNMETMIGMFGRLNVTSLDISSFNTSNLTSMAYAFVENHNLTSINFGNIDTSKVQSMQHMLQACTSLRTIDVSMFNTSSVTTLSGMFAECRSLEYIDLSNFNTSNVTNMNYLFYGCNNLEGFVIDNFDTSNVKYMNGLFYDCDKLTNITLNNFNTGNVEQMCAMFYGLDNLETINISSFDTSKVKKFKHHISGCGYAYGPDLLDNPCFESTNKPMFSELPKLTTIYASTEFVTTAIEYALLTEDGEIFKNTPLLVGGAGTQYVSGNNKVEYAIIDEGETNPGYFTLMPASVLDIGSRVNEKIKNLAGGSKSNVKYIKYSSSLDDSVDTTNSSYIISNGNSTPVYAWFKTDTIYIYSESGKIYLNPNSNSLFYGFNQLISIDTNRLYTDYVTTAISMFNDCSSLTNLNISKWNTSKIESMDGMFSGCTLLTTLDLNSWNTGSLLSARGMFSNCKNLTSLSINRWNTEKLKYMDQMFANCEKLEELDLSNMNVSKVETIYNTFSGMKALNSINLSGWNTASLQNFGYVFTGDISLEELDLSNINISNAYISNIVGGCTNLKKINISNFDLRKAGAQLLFSQAGNIEEIVAKNVIFPIDSTSMFAGLSTLKRIDLENADTSNVTNMTYFFAGCPELLELDLSSFDTSDVTNMKGMFASDSKLVTIKVSNRFVTTSVTTSDSMFGGTTSLEGEQGTSYDQQHIDASYAHVDEGETNPGYFTYKEYSVQGSISKFISNIYSSKYGKIVLLILICTLSMLLIYRFKKRKVAK